MFRKLAAYWSTVFQGVNTLPWTVGFQIMTKACVALYVLKPSVFPKVDSSCHLFGQYSMMHKQEKYPKSPRGSIRPPLQGQQTANGSGQPQHYLFPTNFFLKYFMKKNAAYRSNSSRFHGYRLHPLPLVQLINLAHTLFDTHCITLQCIALY